MNKKGQNKNVHPVMILGIIIFVIPFFGPVVHINFPKSIGTAGLITLFIGIGLTVFKNA